MPPDRYHFFLNTINGIPVPLLRGAAISGSVGAVILISVANILIQSTTPSDISWLEHLTLEGALVFAVIVLWRALVAKDVQLMDNVKTVTQALTASTASARNIRWIAVLPGG